MLWRLDAFPFCESERPMVLSLQDQTWGLWCPFCCSPSHSLSFFLSLSLTLSLILSLSLPLSFSRYCVFQTFKSNRSLAVTFQLICLLSQQASFSVFKFKPINSTLPSCQIWSCWTHPSVLCYLFSPFIIANFKPEVITVALLMGNKTFHAEVALVVRVIAHYSRKQWHKLGNLKLKGSIIFTVICLHGPFSALAKTI